MQCPGKVPTYHWITHEKPQENCPGLGVSKKVPSTERFSLSLSRGKNKKNRIGFGSSVIETAVLA